MIIKKYKLFKESVDNNRHLPTYEDCIELCSYEGSPFYEVKTTIEGYTVSTFNYRMAQFKDFNNPIKDKPNIKGHELRGLCFVFNKDGSLFNRFLLLEKFFNLNQVPESMYSIVKGFKVKHINNKEDGSIATFIKLPNGKVIGKSKMGFDNEQAIGINRIYKNNADVKLFVDWCYNNDLTAIFEYVSPRNRIVLRYTDEELILLRLRDNITGKHVCIKNHLDKIGSIKIAPFEDEHQTIDDLVERSKNEIGKEGWVITFDNGQMIKIKTQEYLSLHGLLTNDLYRENIIIGYILEDKIDDVLAQVPEDEKEAFERIDKIIKIVKKAISDKVDEIDDAYNSFIKSGLSRKDYAITKRKGNEYFPFVMNIVKADEMKNMNEEEILEIFDTMEDYENSLQRCKPYEMAIEWLRSKTSKLFVARDWLKERDETLFFTDTFSSGMSEEEEN